MTILKSLAKFGSNLKVLALGAHADDIELGCGATLLYLKKCFRARIHYVVLSDHSASRQAEHERKGEIIASSKLLQADTFDCFSFTDTEFPNSWRTIQEHVAQLRRDYQPDLVFAPRLNDNHQDHVVVAEAARREFREGQPVWHYEVKQLGQDQFDANIFIDVSGPTGCDDEEYKRFLAETGGRDSFAHRKVFILQKCFISQANRPCMNPELLLGFMRWRALQCSRNIVYAEAFNGKVLIHS